MIDQLFIWIGRNFTDTYFGTATLVQELLWSGAELLIVYMSLAISNLVRTRFSRPPITSRFYLFWCVALANPIILFLMPGVSHDKLMLVNFSIMIYTAVADRKVLIRAFNELIMMSF